MIRYLIKNNLKLMFRSPANIILFILMPLIVSSVLASAFSALMKSYENKTPFDAGYCIEQESIFYVGMDGLKAGGKQTGVNFMECDEVKPVPDPADEEAGLTHEKNVKSVMELRNLNVFVEFGRATYTVWAREDAKAEAQILEYLLNAYVEGADRMKLRMLQVDEAGAEVKLNIERPEFLPAVNSTDYYVIIELAYFGWCALVCAAGLLGAEKKYGIAQKYRVAGLSGTQIYLARFIPMVICVLSCEAISAVVAGGVLDVHWGSPAQSICVFVGMLLAACAFELLIYEITQSMVLSIISSFCIVWFMGYFGGSFETYMFSSLPQVLKNISPIYHGNRALVELSCMGHSNYMFSSLLYSLLLFAGCSVVSIALSRARKRG